MTSPDITNKTRFFEITAVLLTAIAKFVFKDYLKWRLSFIIVMIVFWAGYVYFKKKTNPGIVRYWGFRTDNFKKVNLLILPFGLLTLAICFITGYLNNTINLNWHIIPILILYPVWGIIQQFLLIALTAGNLIDYKGLNLSKGLIIFISAVLFSLVHYPYVWLVAGTFILALFYGFLYLKEKNIYSLGIFHGWLAAIFFYTVVGRDPFLEAFGRLLHLN